MKRLPFNLLIFIILFLVPLGTYADEIQKFQFARYDGSTFTGYLTHPPQAESFPIMLMVHGSQNESIKDWHEDFKQFSMNFGAGLVTLEKQGIYSPEEMDELEYHEHNCLEHRIKDHLWFIEKLKDGLIPGWNGKIIMMGGSEGGRVVAAVSAKAPEVKFSVILTAGGGFTSIEEVKISFMKYFKSLGESDQEIADTLSFLDRQFIQMLNNPTPEKEFLDYTYKWWASHLSRHTVNDLIQINHPIFYAHGTDDLVVPVESADKAYEIFNELGKTNMVYRRIEGCGHDIRLFPQSVIQEMMEMLEQNRSLLFREPSLQLQEL